ncbi:ABC transporter, permease protein EscB [Fructilactobacillus florum 8D]|uniref:ABC transporter, permease protein EscB n=1 Tax=Fructilactobacillus florum 8D TaxID=1221538 RepID=W9EKB7_9LACO|nr:ABC transporter permease [Fructilactobacillus florum]EKK20664.1 ABC transporter, permease protein EscB [Fructilactobacillus florum 2F]ETO40129.1 ABC transporter, permease protein EscB [Fructilactobacillus florum 8D]
MSKIFRQRLTSHITELTKYLKYVFNDFFVIALLFFIGALAFAYGNLLQHLSGGQPWEQGVILLGLVGGLQLGNLATLIQAPDQVFLAPQEFAFPSYLKRAYWYSYALSGCIQLLIWFVLLPFVSLSLGFQSLQLTELLLLMLVLKGGLLAFQVGQLYLARPLTTIARISGAWLLPFGIIAVAVLGWPLVSLLLGCGYLAGVLYWSRARSVALNWKWLVRTESRRMQRLYQIFALFTDVPTLPARPRRRRWADSWLRWLQQDQAHLYLNLYFRSFVRNSTESDLYVRVIFLGTIILLCLSNQLMAIIIAWLLIYMTGVQLTPFAGYFRQNSLLQIYPVTGAEQAQNFHQFYGSLIGIEIILFSLATWWGTSSLWSGAVTLAGGLLLLFGLIKTVVRHQLNKNRRETYAD